MLEKKNIISSKDEIKISDFDIAAGDLSNEIGKKFMKKLWHSIEFHSAFELDKIYFLTSIRKNPAKTSEIRITIKALREKLFFLRESMDHWEYDYLDNKLKLLWSIPHRTQMKNFLRAPEKYSKDIIKWIKQYIKQNDINLDDDSCQIISS